MQFTAIIAILGLALTATANMDPENCGPLVDCRDPARRSIGFTNIPRRWLAQVREAKVEAPEAELKE